MLRTVFILFKFFKIKDYSMPECDMQLPSISWDHRHFKHNIENSQVYHNFFGVLAQSRLVSIEWQASRMAELQKLINDSLAPKWALEVVYG